MIKLNDGWEKSAHWFDQNMGVDGDNFNRNLIDPAMLKLIGNLKDKSVLDIGCGNGYFTAKLAQKAHRVIGTDLQTAVKICRTKYKSVPNLQFLRHALPQPFPKSFNPFDVITAKMVLQYVPQITTFAQESYRHLKPQGKLVIALDHPFHTQFWYAQALAGKPNLKYLELSHYFDPNPKTKISLWGQSKLTWYPRTVSEYLMAFIQIGFSLKQLVELPETKGNITYPRILLLSFLSS